MNIRVDLNFPIKDGTEVVFRSPVDCSQVTGLIVYYLDNGNFSKEFAFADANGNNVGDINHLFAENVVVKVILDVTTGMAFVQNADTNAYLEGRFAELEAKIGTGGNSITSIESITGGALENLIFEKKLVPGTYYLLKNDYDSQFFMCSPAGTLFLATAVDALDSRAIISLPEDTLHSVTGEALFGKILDGTLVTGAYYLATTDFEGEISAHTLYQAISNSTLDEGTQLGGGSADLGDIETALDSIIAIQNSLIGGDGV